MSTSPWRFSAWPHGEPPAQVRRRALPCVRKPADFSLVLLPQEPTHTESQPWRTPLRACLSLKEPQTPCGAAEPAKGGEGRREGRSSAQAPLQPGLSTRQSWALAQPRSAAPAPLCPVQPLPALCLQPCSAPKGWALPGNSHSTQENGLKHLPWAREARWILCFFLSLLPAPQGPWSAQWAPVRSQPRQSRNPSAPEAVPGRLRGGGWELRAEGWEMRVGGWELRAEGWELRAEGREMRAGGWELRAHSWSGSSPGHRRGRPGKAQPASGSAPLERKGSITIPLGVLRASAGSYHQVPLALSFSFELSAPSSLFFTVPCQYCKPRLCYSAFGVLSSSSRRKKFSAFKLNQGYWCCGLSRSCLKRNLQNYFCQRFECWRRGQRGDRRPHATQE